MRHPPKYGGFPPYPKRHGERRGSVLKLWPHLRGHLAGAACSSSMGLASPIADRMCGGAARPTHACVAARVAHKCDKSTYMYMYMCMYMHM